jgi:hypothetical protein
VAVAMAMPAAGLTFASTAMAKEPTGDFAVFKQCPRFTTGVHICLYSETVGGEVTLHKQTVPITKPIVLQGGIKINPETGAESFVGALNGETLSKVAEKVPGGLTDIVNCTEIKGSGILEDLERGSCELVFENGTTGVNAITELAKPATEIGYNEEAFELEEGAALTLPVKIRLENSLLGSECYIGSSSKPLDWALTTGKTHPDAPNTSITGKIGESIYKDGDEFIYFPENTLVNNEFSAPEASGCGGIFSFLIDPIIDAKIGLSSPDGYNTVILNNKLKEAGIKGVIGSEK